MTTASPLVIVKSGIDPAQEHRDYVEFLAEKDEILRLKWIESEKAGIDIGFEKALLMWVIRHRITWLASRAALQEVPPAFPALAFAA